ncbi:MAG: hypothetical protein GW760_01050 [Legionella sp.]|nr:hypothetical protein [Legionella sp.]
MKFFENHVELNAADRSDVLAVLAVLAEVMAPLQTLCNSSRQSEQNDEALAMLKYAERRIYDVINPELSVEKTADEAKIASSTPTRSM